MSLPPLTDNQAFCNVSALDAGIIGLLDEMFIINAKPGYVTTAPSLSFLLQHSQNVKMLVFDLGTRKEVLGQVLARRGTPSKLTSMSSIPCRRAVPRPQRLTMSVSRIAIGTMSATPPYPEDPTSHFTSDLFPLVGWLVVKSPVWSPSRTTGPYASILEGKPASYRLDTRAEVNKHDEANVNLNIPFRTWSWPLGVTESL
ncbi:unnamed protein product [Cyclocybe aegerita]|uniref:Uncharacterized protein n=1 Tax=Cyclocybe aegerita TaxID=1973307 RepID=A0A8S0VRJ8_CYCAE|nr:unnamed protein product [Cyclocybe aegerita]